MCISPGDRWSWSTAAATAARDGGTGAAPGPQPSVNANSRCDRSSGRVAPWSCSAPTPNPPGPPDQNPSEVQPAAVNHPRMVGVRSGGRRCRVQITVAPGRPIAVDARAVRSTSASGTLPKMPHNKSRSTGTTSGQTFGSPASAARTSSRDRRGSTCSWAAAGELGVELDQAAGQVGRTRMAGRGGGQVPAVAGAQRQHPDRTGTGPVERRGDLLDDDGEALRMPCGGIVVLEVPLAPVPRHAGTVALALAGRSVVVVGTGVDPVTSQGRRTLTRARLGAARAVRGRPGTRSTGRACRPR